MKSTALAVARAVLRLFLGTLGIGFDLNQRLVRHHAVGFGDRNGQAFILQGISHLGDSLTALGQPTVDGR